VTGAVDRAFDVVEARHHLHRIAEPGFCEFRTTAFAVEHLESWGYRVATGPDALEPSKRFGVPSEREIERWWWSARDSRADTGVLERMRGGLTGAVASLVGTGEASGIERPRIVALRADLDALPIDETDLETHKPAANGYASTNSGFMHACGHDGHVAIGLAVAQRLSARRHLWSGEFRLILQPAEEGLRGAHAMVAAGAMTGVDDLICFHLGMDVASGAIHTAVRGALASVKLRATFTGHASHAALAPERGRSALLAAAAAAAAIHSLPQHASATTRVNVGALHSGTASNIVPSAAQLLVEARSDDSEVCRELEARVRAALEGSAHAYEVSCVIDVIGQAPALLCSDSLAEHLADAATEMEGVTVTARPAVDTGSDDASRLIDAVVEQGGRGTYVAIGSDLAGGHHTPEFDIDESVLDPAVEYLEQSVLSLLRSA
jgi:aminobenzoyl-glutamate utilization protein A